MAQNITIAGATYSGVPALSVPKASGGMASYVDTSDADAAAGDVLSGKTAYVNGAKVTGTAITIDLQIIVSVATGAAVTATNGTHTVTGTSANGSCTLTVPEAGTWAVSATLSGQASNTQNVVVTDTYSTSLSFISAVLDDNSWEKIKEVSDAGTGANYWAVGDRKAVVLDGAVGNFTFSNLTTYAFIIGFNHNSAYEGTNRIHFQLAKTALSGGTDICFVDSKYATNISSTGYFSMNSSNTNVGGWASSQIRTTILGTSLSNYTNTFIGSLPSDLCTVLKSVTKYTDNTGGGAGSISNNVTSTTDYMFLLSEYEVFGSISYANTYEAGKQAQYSYYSAGNSKIKYEHTGVSTAAVWWLRSPYSTASTAYLRVQAGGTLYQANAFTSYGLAPCFCV